MTRAEGPGAEPPSADTITPHTRVAELLERWPELEAVLVRLSPAFGKLKNPVVRRTIARVTTLEKAASVAGITVRDLVGALRRAAGLADDAGPADSETHRGTESPKKARPAWMDTLRVSETLDADAMLDKGQSPVSYAMRWLRNPPESGILCISASFEPAPLADAARQKGAQVHLEVAAPGQYRLYIHVPA